MRFPDVLSDGVTVTHSDLITNQRVWCSNSSVLEWALDLKQQVNSNYMCISSDYIQNYIDDATKVHVKRELRTRTCKDNLDKNPGHYDVHNDQTVGYKFKHYESLPFGKRNRGTCDLGTSASLVGGFLLDHVKDGFSSPYVVHGCQAKFVKPTGKTLDEGFHDLIHPTHIMEYVYYSDDACVAINCVDRTTGKPTIWRANVDISACDGSHFSPVFNTTKYIMDSPLFTDVVNALFAQLERPLRFDLPSGGSEVLFPTGPRLYSGSVLTTVVNNVANMLIFLSLSGMLNGKRVYSDELPLMLALAARTAGYVVTCDVCLSLEQLQFLKRSPSIVDGGVVSWLNLGVWLRNYGYKEGDLPGKRSTPMPQRIMSYNAGVVDSHKHDGNHTISSAFRSTVQHVVDRAVVEGSYFGAASNSESFIPDECLASRYDVTPEEIAELADLIRRSSPGQIITSPVINRIMLVDYGFKIET